MVRTFKGRKPRVHKTAFVHDAAEIIGDVSIGARASIWPTAVLRGDVDAVRVGDRTNIQDGAVVHCRHGRPAVIGRGVTVGHRAIIHGAKVGDLCLVGMGAIVMEASVGRECIIGAGALVPAGMTVPPRSLVLGMPAKVRRKLTPAELKSLKASERTYMALSEVHRRTSRAVFG